MGVPKRRRYRTSAAAFVSGITLAAPIMRAMRRYDIVTFDCYGTLIDWESGIAKAFRDAGLDDRGAVLRAYAEHEPIAEGPPCGPYREALRAAPAAAPRRGVAADGAAGADRRGAAVPTVSRGPRRRRAPRRARARIGCRGYELPRGEPAVVDAVPRHERGARAPARHRLSPRHSLQRRRRSSRGDAAALHRRFRSRRHRAAGPLVQAEARALPRGARGHRRRAVAARGGKQLPRHRADERAAHRERLDQPSRRAAARRRRADARRVPRPRGARRRDRLIRSASSGRTIP